MRDMNSKQLELFNYGLKISQKVNQSNRLVEAPYENEFSIHEIKLFEIALAGCSADDYKYVELKNDKEFIFSASELASILNTKVSVISMEIEKTAIRMTKKTLHLRKDLDDGTVEFISIAMIPYARYDSGIFRFRLNYEMIPYVIQLNGNFTQFDLKLLLSLNSPNAIKLYKLLLMHKNKYRSDNKIFTIEELKKQFGLSNKYPQYGSFKQKIIEPSIKIINDFSDLNVEYVEHKLGRRVDSIKFYFKHKIKNNIKDNIEIVAIDDMVEVDQILGLMSEEVSLNTKLLLQRLIVERGHDFVLGSVSYASKNSKSNFEKYLIDTINNNWAETYIKKNTTKKNLTQKKKENLDQKKISIELQRQEENTNRSEIEHLFTKLLDEEKQNYINLATRIYDKNSTKFSKIKCDLKDLIFSVFAVSTNRYYNKMLENYVHMMSISLSINDYLV